MQRLFGKVEDHPYIPPQNPFQVFLLLFGVYASIPLLGGNSGSAALERVLTDTAVIMWGVALLVGSTAALVGLWAPARHAVGGLLLERAGLILVGGAAAIYCWVIWREAGHINDVRYVASIQIAYALACFWRCVQITRGLRWATQNVTKEPEHREDY